VEQETDVEHQAAGARPASRILLASDLSCRSDRALERACDLASQWDARLVVASALEEDFHDPSWRSRREQVVSEVRAELETELASRRFDWDVVVAPGRPSEVVLDAASSRDCELIVTGVARNELLGRSRPGRTVETLVRHAPRPVLIVKRRVHGPYRRMLALTNFSRASEYSAQQAARLFPAAAMTVLHAYRVPFSGFLSESANQDALRASAHEALDQSLARLSPGLPAGYAPEALVEYGAPDDLAADYVRDRSPDLIVLGRRRQRSRTTPGLIERILTNARCDVLVVPEPAE
jgi:nucleotide-binding universal stress UspA family protein